MFVRISFCIAFSVVCKTTFGDLPRTSLEYTTSVSGSHDARSLFSNPAALGFQTELNGAQLLSSYAYGINKTQADELAIGLSYGYFGFGVERLSVSDGPFTRFTLGAGLPLSPYVYIGNRFRFTRSDIATLDRFHSWDLGLQYRAFPFLSFGTLAEGLNQPEVNGSKTPLQFTFGATLKPLPWLELAADINTPSRDFGKKFGYSTNAVLGVTRGIRFRAGYHNIHKIQFGMEFRLGHASLFSAVQPDHEKKLSFGIQFSGNPYPSSLEPETAVKLEVDSTLGEEPKRPTLFSKGRPHFLGLLQSVAEAKDSCCVKHVIVKLDDFPLGMAAAEELHEALWELRQSGKTVEVFLGHAGIKEYLIASAANRIHMAGNGQLEFTGLKSQRYFFKGTMDKIGIEAEFFAKGKYKSAPESFTRKQSSLESRQATLAGLKVAESEILQILSRSRSIDAHTWQTMLKTGLFNAEEALQWRLIDSLTPYSRQVAELEKTYSAHRTFQKELLSLPPRIAVVVAEGTILPKSIPSLFESSGITPSKMEAYFKQALSDPRVQAIVLRVNSPGGEILASEEIAAMVEGARETKPVIVSMGDVAASGGYFIAAPGEKIFARSTTITGSIGVFSGKFNLGRLYEKIGLQKEILSHSPHADLFSEDRPLNEENKKIFLRQLNLYYDNFISYVSHRRGLAKEEVEQAAGGRVWLGVEAQKLKLTDEKGGLMQAIDHAASRAGLKRGEYEVLPIFTGSPLLLDVLGMPIASQILILTLLKYHSFLYWSEVAGISE